MEKDLRFAVLIDAENFSSKYVRQLFDEIAEEGVVTTRRVYGGWESPQLKAWKKVLEEFSISTRQELCYSTGKSASDSAMIIDAMDILYGETVDGFCIASSDGDFTNLARRIREAGKMILGAGENKTPKAFVNSCNRFIYVDMLDAEESPVPTPAAAPAREEKELGPTPIEAICGELVRYFESKISKGYEGREYLSTIGNHLRKKFPEFDCRNYRCRSLYALIRTFDGFELEDAKGKSGAKSKQIFVVYKGSQVDDSL